MSPRERGAPYADPVNAHRQTARIGPSPLRWYSASVGSVNRPGTRNANRADTSASPSGPSMRKVQCGKNGKRLSSKRTPDCLSASWSASPIASCIAASSVAPALQPFLGHHRGELQAYLRLLLPFMGVIAVYFFMRGHNLPGGGFVARRAAQHVEIVDQLHHAARPAVKGLGDADKLQEAVKEGGEGQEGKAEQVEHVDDVGEGRVGDLEERLAHGVPLDDEGVQGERGDEDVGAALQFGREHLRDKLLVVLAGEQRAHHRPACCLALLRRLVIAGAQDAGAPPAMSEAIAARIAGAELRVIEAADIGVLEQPQAFAEAVGGFIAARCGG